MIRSLGVTPSRQSREIIFEQLRRTLIIFEGSQLEIDDRSEERVCEETATG